MKFNVDHNSYSILIKDKNNCNDFKTEVLNTWTSSCQNFNALLADLKIIILLKWQVQNYTKYSNNNANHKLLRFV